MEPEAVPQISPTSPLEAVRAGSLAEENRP
jgi:hypothetical protein